MAYARTCIREVLALRTILFWCLRQNIVTSDVTWQVYVWSKHNPFIHMSFLGLFTFTAAYLPWVSVGFAHLILMWNYFFDKLTHIKLIISCPVLIHYI